MSSKRQIIVYVKLIFCVFFPRLVEPGELNLFLMYLSVYLAQIKLSRQYIPLGC